MSQMLLKSTSALVAAAALAMIATAASAEATARQRQHSKQVRPVYYDEQPPLTVNKRSFLDPGPVVPVGSMSNYVTANTIFNRTPDQTFARSKYGNEELPRPLEIPARSGPLLEFETPAYPY
jgi:hypothetical protein